jgi:hypothetical protein
MGLGVHTLQVRAIDLTGYVDETPASYTWTVVPPPPNCGAPVTLTANIDAWIDQNSSSSNKGDDSILKVQGKSSNNNMRALVGFNLPSLSAGCQVESATLRLYAASGKNGRTLQALQVAASWTEMGVTWANQPATTGTPATTTSGKGWRQWTVTGQVQAMYTNNANYGFLIRDAVENSGSHEQQFHAREKGENVPQLVLTFAAAPPPADTTPPETAITSGPDSGSTSTEATFTFVANETDATFECSLDGAEFSACISPVEYTGLSVGVHRFQVRATDVAGNLDGTPTSYTWSVIP